MSFVDEGEGGLSRKAAVVFATVALILPLPLLDVGNHAFLLVFYGGMTLWTIFTAVSFFVDWRRSLKLLLFIPLFAAPFALDYMLDRACQPDMGSCI